MTTKLQSLNECRGYLGVFIGKARADAMSGFDLAAAVREHGAELAPTVTFQMPTPTAPARADSVYREDASSKARPRDRHADAYKASFETGSHPGRVESLSEASMRETREKAAQPLPTAKPDRRAEAYAQSFREAHSVREAKP